MKNTEKKKSLFGKKVISLALSGILLATPLLLTSCGEDGKDGEDGKNGADGAKYYSGTENIENVNEGAVGDFYIDTDDYKLYQKSSAGKWVLVMDDFGKPGNNGVSSYTHIRYAKDELGTDISEDPEGCTYISIITTTSPEAPANSAFKNWSKFVGDDGLTPYIGYDGYFYYGSERSEYKVADTMGENTAENTIALAGNKYFTEASVNMAEEQIALMSNFFRNINKTGCSGTTVTSIQVYAKTAGTLTISTANVKDVVRRSGISPVALSGSVQKSLTEGLNTITLESFSVAPTDTVVLGKAGDTAVLAVYSGVANNDEQGLFAKFSSRDLYSVTDGVNDKLAVKLEISESFAEHYASLTEESERAPFVGKYVSILGDSISSYDGISNVNTYNTNVQVGGPSCEYNGSKHGITSPDQTYWMSFINKMGMKLCVNNSVVADTVVNGYDRVSHLADNTVSNNETFGVINPDFIIIYFGINDIRKSEAGSAEGIREDLITEDGNGGFTYKAPQNFAEGYEIILHKATHLYGEDVKIVCATFPLHSFKTGEGAIEEHTQKYNNIIRTLAPKYGAAVADFYNMENYDNVYTDDNLHPTLEGMKLMAEYVEEAFKTIVEK